MNNKTKYTEEFKREAVQLVLQENYTIAKAAAHLGIGSTTLGHWVKRLGGAQRGVESTQNKELKRLKKENRELRMERDILKKAAVDSIDQCNNNIFLLSSRGYLNEAHFYRNGKRICF